MKLLAIEFSSAQRSVAVVDAVAAPGKSVGSEGDRAQIRHGYCASEVIESGGTGGVAARSALGQAAHPFAMIEEALRAAALEREQIECIAIGVGPGSYSGIRSAIAIAQGWKLAAPNLKLLAVSSAESMAAQAHAEGIVGEVYVVIDAQRNEFYLAGFQITNESWLETQRLHLATKAEVQACEGRGILIGTEISKWFPAARLVFPRAAMIAQLALGRNEFIAAQRLEPIYLRETSFVKAPPPRVLPS